MRHAETLTLALICLGLSPLALKADREAAILPPGFETASSPDGALVMAREKNKALIVYYTRTRCPPCNILQSRLRREEVAAPFREGYVFTAIWGSSMGRTERRHYRDIYNVPGAPTWPVFNYSGDYVCTSIGGFTSDQGGKRLHESIQSHLRAGSYAGQAGARDCISSGDVK